MQIRVKSKNRRETLTLIRSVSNPSANVMYNVSNGTLKVGQAVQYKACARSLKAAEIFRSFNESSPPLPLFSTFRFLFTISSRVFAVEQF